MSDLESHCSLLSYLASSYPLLPLLLPVAASQHVSTIPMFHEAPSVAGAATYLSKLRNRDSDILLSTSYKSPVGFRTKPEKTGQCEIKPYCETVKNLRIQRWPFDVS